LTAPLSGYDLNGIITPTINWYYRSLPNFVPLNCVAPAFLNFISNNNPTACAPVGPPLAPIRENNFGRIVRNDFTFPQYDAENKMWNKKQMYRFLKNNQNWISLNAPDDSTYQNFYVQQQNNNIGAYEQINDFMQAENFSSANSLNQSVNANTAAELNRKEVNRIYLLTWANGIEAFNPADSASLLNIAYQDAVTGGDAVYSARTMLRLFIEPISGEKIQQDNTSEEIPNYDYKLYPNPNDGNMTLSYTIEKDAELQITDVTGKIICSYKLSASETSIDIICDNLANGVYIYKIIYNTEIIQLDKIIIIK